MKSKMIKADRTTRVDRTDWELNLLKQAVESKPGITREEVSHVF